MGSKDTTVSWERWGEVDPLFAVAPWPGKHHGGVAPWTDDEVAALGRRDWGDFHERWCRYGLEGGVGLEIGCGVGRLTAPMAARFAHLHAVDVAPAMLRRAKAAVDGLPVTLHEADGRSLPLDDGSVDGALSVNVFAHLPDDVAVGIWRELARVLSPGGTVLVQTTLSVEQPRDGRQWRRQRGRTWEVLEATLQRLGFTDIELLVFRLRSSGTPQHCVLARRR